MSSPTNLSAILYGKLDLRLQEGPVPTPAANEVVVALKRCGVCGTDLHFWQEADVGGTESVVGVVVGHEASGVVISVGQNVTRLKVGDRVAPELGVPCSRCQLCREGRYNLCKPFSTGGFAHYLCHPQNFCHKLPNNVSFDNGALLEPLAVAARAVSRAGIEVGSAVLITGAGAVGLCCVMAAGMKGASQICITDVNESRLEMARKFGATHCVVMSSSHSPRESAREVIQTLGRRPQYVLECSGVGAALQTSIYACESGGVVAVVGIYSGDVSVPLLDAATREVDIRGVFSYAAPDYPAAIAMVASGRFDPALMISHRFDLPHVVDSLELLRTRQEGVIKIMINCE